jgi:hypothetical protein
MPADVLHGSELLSCPPSSAGGLALDIRRRGNVPVTVGNDCIIELTPADVAENWASARAIRKPVVAAMVAEIGHRLALSLASEEAETEDLAGEAAACLFLSLHHRSVPIHTALEGCRVLWNARNRSEQVECLA